MPASLHLVDRVGREGAHPLNSRGLAAEVLDNERRNRSLPAIGGRVGASRRRICHEEQPSHSGSLREAGPKEALAR